MRTTRGRSIIIDSHQPNQDNNLDSSSIHLSAYTYPCHVLNTYKRETSEKTRKSGKTMTTTTKNQKDKMGKMVKMGEVYKKDTKGSWRHRVWTALYTDNERAFGECFPDAGMVKRASRDIWKPRQPPSERELIEVLTSLRPHINGGKGALKCLTWLLETYPRVYDTGVLKRLRERVESEGGSEEMVALLKGVLL